MLLQHISNFNVTVAFISIICSCEVLLGYVLREFYFYSDYLTEHVICSVILSFTQHLVQLCVGNTCAFSYLFLWNQYLNDIFSSVFLHFSNGILYLGAYPIFFPGKLSDSYHDRNPRLPCKKFFYTVYASCIHRFSVILRSDYVFPDFFFSYNFLREIQQLLPLSVDRICSLKLVCSILEYWI